MPKNQVEPPEFVLDGTFEDTEWRNAAAKPEGQRTKNEQRVFEAGPRSHPFSSTAVMDVGDNGERRWFPSPTDAQTWKQQHEGKRTAPKAETSAGEAGTEKQAAAEREGNKTRPVGGVV